MIIAHGKADHIIPKSVGGDNPSVIPNIPKPSNSVDNPPENLALSCRTCTTLYKINHHSKSKDKKQMMLPTKTVLMYREKESSDWEKIENTKDQLQLDGRELKKGTVYQICVQNVQPQVSGDVSTPLICFDIVL